MTREQKEALRTLFTEAPTMIGWRLVAHGHRCAAGAILHHAGVSDDALRDLDLRLPGIQAAAPGTTASEVIFAEYRDVFERHGLDREQLGRFVSVADSMDDGEYHGPDEVRGAVLRALDALPVAP